MWFLSLSQNILLYCIHLLVMTWDNTRPALWDEVRWMTQEVWHSMRLLYRRREHKHCETTPVGLIRRWPLVLDAQQMSAARRCWQRDDPSRAGLEISLCYTECAISNLGIVYFWNFSFSILGKQLELKPWKAKSWMKRDYSIEIGQENSYSQCQSSLRPRYQLATWKGVDR